MLAHSHTTCHVSEDNTYGWYEDLDSPRLHLASSADELAEREFHGHQDALIRAMSLPLPATHPPMYILESSLSTQQLWYETAGRRPRQPSHEREYFERLWMQNFEKSSVPEAAATVRSLSGGKLESGVGAHMQISSPGRSISGSGGAALGLMSHGHRPADYDYDAYPVACAEEEEEVAELVTTLDEQEEEEEALQRSTSDASEAEVIYKSNGPFSNPVSKSFMEWGSMTVQLPRHKVSRLHSGEVHASFLVVVVTGGMSFGVWKRHSDFKLLAEELRARSDASLPSSAPSAPSPSSATGDLEAGSTPIPPVIDVFAQGGVLGGIDAGLERQQSYCSFKNSLLSWQCVLQKKRWFRCLDPDYLALKGFLLERFMHDVLFESPSPSLITNFLGLGNVDVARL